MEHISETIAKMGSPRKQNGRLMPKCQAVENEPQIIKTPKNCIECGVEYEAHTGEVLGVKIEFGGGYCPKCRAVKLEEQDRKEAEQKHYEQETMRRQFMDESGIPMRFKGSRFTNFSINVDRSIISVYHECKKFVEAFSFLNPRLSKSLVLYSSSVWGVGKTHLACAVANSIIAKWAGEIMRCPVYFITEPQLFLKVRATFNRNHNEGQYQETEESIYKRLTTVPLLILDDVGKEDVSDPRFVQRVLFAIIDGRYQNMLPIVMTANLNPDELDAHLGGTRGNSASIDRLAEMTGNVFWEIRGKSYRDIANRRGIHGAQD